MQGLEGVKVLELGHMVSAAYATKLMADLGAEVIKVEEPGGDRARQRGPFPGGVADTEKSGLFLSLNTNKRSVTLDLPQDADKLSQLVSDTQILVHNYPSAQMAARGIDYQTFRQLNPSLVMCSITPFGLSGPHKDYHAYELTVSHAGGWAWLCPGASEEPELPPLKTFGHQCEFQGGLAGAMSTLAAYYRALETGQSEHIDLSTQAYITSILEQNFVYYSYLDRVASRLGRRQLSPWRLYQCKDGLIFLVVAEEDQWQRLVELMGNPEWASWDIFQDMYNRSKNHDVLKMYLEEWMADWKVEDLFRAAQAKRICFAPMLSMPLLAKQEQLHARNFFVEVEHPKAGKLTHLGPPYQLKEPWWQIRRPAPLLGEHTQEVLTQRSDSSQPLTPNPQSPHRRLPLEGVRVAAFTWVWAGPHGAMQLANLGAEVIKIESEIHTDMTRRVRLPPTGMKQGPNRSGVFNQWNQGLKSLQLNVSTPRGLAIAKGLIKNCDVVMDNFATGVMERMGLGYEELKQLKPDIIVASMSGYGHAGPLKDNMGYGPAIGPLTGITALTGHPGGPPQELGISYGDPTGGVNAAVAVCAALAARKRTGSGQYIDLALWDTTAALVPEGWMEYAMNGTEPPRIGNRDPLMSPHNCYRCTDARDLDEWVSIACGTEEEWQAFCQAIGQPQIVTDARFQTLTDRKANEDTLDQLITEWTQSQTKWEVTKLLQAAGVAAFPSMNNKDLDEDPHLNERGFFAELEHAEVGVRKHTGIPWLLSESPNGIRTPAPLLGQHTDEIMRDVLGHTEEEIAQLKEDKVLS